MADTDALCVLARRHMKEATGDEIVDWAELELNAGFVSPSIIAISCWDKPTHWEDVAALFYQALSDLGYSAPPFEECLHRYARLLATEIVAGRLAPLDGCSKISAVCEWLDCPRDLFSSAWMELVNGYDPDSTERLSVVEVENQIRRFAAAMVDS